MEKVTKFYNQLCWAMMLSLLATAIGHIFFEKAWFTGFITFLYFSLMLLFFFLGFIGSIVTKKYWIMLFELAVMAFVFWNILLVLHIL